MTSELKVDKITPASGTNTQIGEAGDTTNLSAGTVTLPTSIITGATEKTTLVDADKFLISDSAASGAFKHVQKSNLPSGTFEKLLSGSASSAVTHNFGNFMNTSKYNVYMVNLSKVIGLQGNAFDFQFSDSGGEFSGSHYWYSAAGHRSNASSYSTGSENQGQAPLGTPLAASASDVGSYLFYIYNNPNSTTFGSSVYGHNWGFRADYSDFLFADFGITYNAADNITGFEIHATGNDATTFDYAIYGILK